MTVFLIVAALLAAVAMAFVLYPLLRKGQPAGAHIQRDQLNLAVLRDQLRELDADLAAGTIDASGYQGARHDLERRVAEEVPPEPAVSGTASGARRWSGIVIGLLVPALAVAIYLKVGAPAALDPAQREPAKDNAHETTPEQITSMVDRLAKRLQAEPDNAEGWNMLARSYSSLGRFEEASVAYARLVKLVPNDAALYADYADVLGMARNRSLQGEPEKLVNRALEIDPKNVKALSLSASAAFERKDYKRAVELWQKMAPLVPADSDMARSVSANIAETQSLMGLATTMPKPAAPAAPPLQPVAAAGAAAQVSGSVDIDPALRAQAADTDTVFIFARAAQGARFPLAVLRKQVKDLPLEFVLDDSMSMTPDAKLSSVPMVVVGARVSKTGNASPSAGDFEGWTEPVSPGAAHLKIRIDKRKD
jgi:cytochrome c-type biogenesis protein CcmH